jgi:hypothetical protein
VRGSHATSGVAIPVGSHRALRSPVEVIHQVLVFSLDLRVKRLDQVTDGNQSDQFIAFDHGQLTAMMIGHLAHGFGQGP